MAHPYGNFYHGFETVQSQSLVSSYSLKHWGHPSPCHTPVQCYQSESVITDNTLSFILFLILLIPSSTMKNQHAPHEAIMHWPQNWGKVLCNSPHIPSKQLEVNVPGNLTTTWNESSIHSTKCHKFSASAQTMCVIPTRNLFCGTKIPFGRLFLKLFLWQAPKSFWIKKTTLRLSISIPWSHSQGHPLHFLMFQYICYLLL